ncbi:MAG: hypothetical protein V4739_17460 [Pseudomonadota bacterium]
MTRLAQIHAEAAAICRRTTLDWADPYQVTLREASLRLRAEEVAELARIERLAQAEAAERACPFWEMSPSERASLRVKGNEEP